MGPMQKKILSALKKFKKNTGIDILDIEKMKQIGLDLDRGAAVSRNIDDNSEILYIPVKRDDLFPFVMAGMFKKVFKITDQSWYPVISPYLGHGVYQIGANIFISAVSGYCVITTRGDTARDVIKRAAKGKRSFLESVNYRRFVFNHSDRFKMKFYMTQRFLTYKEKKDINKKRNYLLKNVSYETVKKTTKGRMPPLGGIPSFLVISVSLSEGDLSARISYPPKKPIALMSSLRLDKMLWIKNHSHVYFSPLRGQYNQGAVSIPFQNYFFQETMNNLIKVMGKKRMETLVNRSYSSYEKIFFESAKGKNPSLYFIPLKQGVSLKKFFKGYKIHYYGKRIYVKKRSGKKVYYMSAARGGIMISSSWVLLKKAYLAKRGGSLQYKGDLFLMKMRSHNVVEMLKSIDNNLVFSSGKNWVVVRGAVKNSTVVYSINFYKNEPGK
jgi:hypothetical protein|nr:hypothetical protein [Spirochaetaceae bacterium]